MLKQEEIRETTIETLLSTEKDFAYCFAESTVPVLYALSDIAGKGSVTPGELKSYLQSQSLPTLDEPQSVPVGEWENLMFQEADQFKTQKRALLSEEQKSELALAINQRRVMSGFKEAANEVEMALPRYMSPGSMFRDYAHAVPFPDRSAFRINIPDHPGELPDEVILNRIVKKFWSDPCFRGMVLVQKFWVMLKQIQLFCMLEKKQ